MSTTTVKPDTTKTEQTEKSIWSWFKDKVDDFTEVDPMYILGGIIFCLLCVCCSSSMSSLFLVSSGGEKDGRVGDKGGAKTINII